MKTTFFGDHSVCSGLEDQETFEGIDAGGTRTTILCISGSCTAWVKFCPSFHIVSLGAFSTRPTCLRQVRFSVQKSFCLSGIFALLYHCLKSAVFIFNCQTCALAWCQFYDIIITVLIKQCNCNNACDGFEKRNRTDIHNQPLKKLLCRGNCI